MESYYTDELGGIHLLEILFKLTPYMMQRHYPYPGWGGSEDLYDSEFIIEETYK